MCTLHCFLGGQTQVTPFFGRFRKAQRCPILREYGVSDQTTRIYQAMWGFHAHARKFLGFWNKYQSTLYACWILRGRHLYFGVWCNFDGCCCLDGGRYNFKQISQVFVHDQVCCIWDLNFTWTSAADLLDRQRDTDHSEHDRGCLLSRACYSCEYRFQR